MKEPTALAVMYCKAHPTEKTTFEAHHRSANKAAKEAAETGILALIPETTTNHDQKFDFWNN